MRKSLLFIVLLIPFIGFLINKRMDRGGGYRQSWRPYLYPWYQKCWQVDLHGVEDIAVHTKGGVAFLSALDKRKFIMDEIEDPNAGIYLMSMTSDDVPIKKLPLVGFPGTQLHPYGIYLFETKRAEILIFVVDHQSNGDVIQVFEFRKEQLYFKYNVTSPLFASLRDVVAVSNNSFYVTNDHFFQSKKLQIIEDIIGTCNSDVIFYNGKEASVAASGLCKASGINVNPDSTILYVTETSSGFLDIFHRDKKSGVLTEAKKSCVEYKWRSH